MNGNKQLSLALPKPGRGLTWVLGVVFAVGVLESLFHQQAFVARAIAAMVCDADAVVHGQVWRLVTAGLVTDPNAIAPLLFTLLGLYFFSAPLEAQWGTGRFIRFIVACVVLGYVAGVAVDRLAPASMALLHPGATFGAFAAITGTSVAWARMNARAQVRLFFILPVSGRAFFWITLGYCAVNVVWPGLPDGVVAPFGGVAAGLLLTGDPSPGRRAYLNLKLAYLRRVRRTPTAHEIAFGPARAKSKKGRRADGPVLRVLPGGMDEDLSKREPPKDKRYLN